MTPAPRLIPVVRGTKTAAVPWERYQRTAPTADEVARWRETYVSWAMLTGVPSGIVVVDVDPRHGGTGSMAGLNFPTTRTILTPSSGWHFYYACPDGGLRTAPGIRPGIDLKADKAYVLVPPSQINGIAYEVAVDAPIANPPAWILKPRPRPATRGQGNPVGSAWADLLHDGVAEGERNTACARLAGWLLGRNMTRDESLAILLLWNARNAPPLEDIEVTACLDSIAGADASRRGAAHRGVDL